MAFDAAIMNVLRDIRKEQADKLDALIFEQRRTNTLLEQLAQATQGQPRQWAGAPR